MPKRQLTYMWGVVAAISLLAPSVAQIPQPVADSARSSRPRPTARSWVAMEDLLAVYTIKPGRAARCVRLSPIGRQPLRARAARSLAARQSHRSPHRRGLCSRLERRGRYPLFRSPDHRSGAGQSQGALYEAFPAAKPGGWSRDSSGTTPQSTAAGLILRSRNSAPYRPNAPTAASPTNKPSSRTSPPGSGTAMSITPRPIGTSQPHTLTSNSSTCTRQSD